MEAGFIIITVLIALASIVIGIHIEKSRAKRRNVIGGVLNVIYSDFEPQLFLQLEIPIEDVASRKQATFDVNVIR